MRILSGSAFAGAALAGILLLAGMVCAEPFHDSGIEGVISVSPSKPGPIRKGEESVAPVGNMEFVVKNGDMRITSFTTDSEGRFRVSLPPGHYTVLREDSGSRAGHWRFEIDVAAGEFKKVSWTGDSGMR
jgi:hypothetical protein